MTAACIQRFDEEPTPPFVVSLSNHGRLSTIALMPRGSHFLLRRQKKVTKEEAAPTFALIQNLG